jgi:hypothetical protein
MNSRRFLIFQCTFWCVSALLLFLYGLSYGHWKVALIRNIYIPVLGFFSSWFLVYLFDRYQLKELKSSLPGILLMSFTTACVLAFVVNPITYGLLGYNLSELTLTHYTQDLLYFVLFYVLWCILYLLYFVAD